MASGGTPLPEVFIEFLKAVEDMNSTIMVPQFLVDLSEETLAVPASRECSNDKPDILAEPSGEYSGLYGHYHMLLQIKDELTTGRETEVRGCFRNQIKSVVKSLQHFTSLAKALTQNYCQVCEGRSVPTVRRVVSDSNLVEHGAELQAYKRRKFSSCAMN